MSETGSQILSGVPETSLAALDLRAMESQRPDALIKDEKAMALAHLRSTRHIEAAIRTARIYHFRLGEAAG